MAMGLVSLSYRRRHSYVWIGEALEEVESLLLLLASHGGLRALCNSHLSVYVVPLGLKQYPDHEGGLCR